MRQLLTTYGIGLVAGVLSGAFGIGGGIVTTPGVRLLLGAPALVAVGTPLPVILPSAATGAWGYFRKGALEARVAVVSGIAGSAFAVLGAAATRWVGGSTVLLVTAVLVVYTAADMVMQIVRPPRLGLMAAEERDAFEPAEAPPAPLAEVPCSDILGEHPPSAARLRNCARHPRHATPVASGPQPLWKLAAIGALAGTYSGFLGLGGGFVLVPILTRWLRFDIKRAIGTSLMTIAILAVPGTIMHAVLGHVDWHIAGALVVGVVPGAWLGSRITLGSSDRTVRIGFAAMLLIVGCWLAAAELGWLPS